MPTSEECKDFKKDVIHDENGSVTFPVYHVTLDADSVCKTGLKTSEEMKGCTALGCGSRTKKLVSFTTDLDIAKRIIK